MAKKKAKASKKAVKKAKKEEAPMKSKNLRSSIATILVGALIAGIPWLEGVAINIVAKWILTVAGIVVLLKGVQKLRQ